MQSDRVGAPLRNAGNRTSWGRDDIVDRMRCLTVTFARRSLGCDNSRKGGRDEKSASGSAAKRADDDRNKRLTASSASSSCNTLRCFGEGRAGG